MALEEIPRLSRKLLASSLAEDGAVCLLSKDYLKHTSALPDKLRAEVNELMQSVALTIPTDFYFCLFFEIQGANIRVIFEDGNTECDALDAFFTSRKSLLRNLRRVSWDPLRAELIQRGGIFDELVSEADDRPVNIPSSEAAAKRYGDALVQEIGKNRRINPRSPYTLIIARDDLGICSEQFTSRDEVVHTIADRMTTRNDILAVLEQCVPWSFDEIEIIKLQAVEGLGPISRAKAEGRLVF